MFKWKFSPQIQSRGSIELVEQGEKSQLFVISKI
jgi:hypothetical protein